jgi:hypothetical protein
LASIQNLKYTLAKKYDHEGGIARDKDWGVSLAEEDIITPDIKLAMMEAVLSVDKVKCLVTEKRDEGFFSRFL